MREVVLAGLSVVNKLIDAISFIDGELILIWLSIVKLLADEVSNPKMLAILCFIFVVCIVYSWIKH
jgi:hypothetical protein